MTLLENDFVGITAENAIHTLKDLGIEITDISQDEDEIMYIETSIDYYLDFVNGICCYSGYEELLED